jgi:hypothetical protein
MGEVHGNGHFQTSTAIFKDESGGCPPMGPEENRVRMMGLPQPSIPPCEVFLAVGDPVRVGAVETLAHPGGNMTGVTYESSTESWAKRIQLLKEILPDLDRMAVLKAAGDANSTYAMALTFNLEFWRKENCIDLAPNRGLANHVTQTISRNGCLT